MLYMHQTISLVKKVEISITFKSFLCPFVISLILSPLSPGNY